MYSSSIWKQLEEPPAQEPRWNMWHTESTQVPGARALSSLCSCTKEGCHWGLCWRTSQWPKPSNLTLKWSRSTVKILHPPRELLYCTELSRVFKGKWNTELWDLSCLPQQHFEMEGMQQPCWGAQSRYSTISYFRCSCTWSEYVENDDGGQSTGKTGLIFRHK